MRSRRQPGTEYGWTPLLTRQTTALQAGNVSHRRGADVNRANKGGWTPLYLATDNRNIEVAIFRAETDMDHLESIKFLLDRGAKPNARIKTTLDPNHLYHAVVLRVGRHTVVRAGQSSDIELMKVLLAHGADPKARRTMAIRRSPRQQRIGWVEGVTYEHSAKANLETIMHARPGSGSEREP